MDRERSAKLPGIRTWRAAIDFLAMFRDMIGNTWAVVLSPMIEITERAAERLEDLCEQREATGKSAVRLCPDGAGGARGHGCSCTFITVAFASLTLACGPLV
jgi:hypothetical protein